MDTRSADDEIDPPGARAATSPEPQIEIRLPKGSDALHRLAAEVELFTPAPERWTIQTKSFYDARGRLYVEIADAPPAEQLFAE